MSQVTDFTIPSADLDMAELKATLEAAFAALGSANRGGTAPSNPFNGMAWLDTSVSNLETLKVYLAAGWISLATINTTTGVVSFNLNAASIVESLIADAAVTASKLAANSVTTSKIANGNVTTDKLADANVTAAKLASNSVTDAKLATKSPGTILSNIAGSDATPTGNTLSAILDAILGNTRGSIIYRGASGWGLRAPGTEGQILTAHGSSADPSWADRVDSPHGKQLILSSTTFTIPANVTTIYVSGSGGGGGGGGQGGAGGTGGSTSFGSLVTLAGGTGGGAAGGSGSGGTYGGGAGTRFQATTNTAYTGTAAGGSGGGINAGVGGIGNASGSSAPANSGSGGGGSGDASGLTAQNGPVGAGGGGAGKWTPSTAYTVTPGQAHTVTIGAGGSAGSGTYGGGAGGSGWILVEW